MSSKLSNRFKKLEICLKDGNYYEAHQIYRTIYYRLEREKQFKDIYNILLDGSLKLFEKNEHNSGADLALLLVETMGKLKSASELGVQCETELLENLRKLFENILPNSPERITFVSKLLKIPYLSMAILRRHFAEVLWKEKNYPDARSHFIHSSDNGNQCALMLIEYQLHASFEYEIDLMIAQFVFQVLCIKNEQLANNAFFCYTSKHPKISCGKPPFISPLLNFVFFLMVAIDKFRGKSQIFDFLRNQYSNSLNRDPSYQEYLNQIGQIYFSCEKSSPNDNMNIFRNLLQSIFVPELDEEPIVFQHRPITISASVQIPLDENTNNRNNNNNNNNNSSSDNNLNRNSDFELD